MEILLHINEKVIYYVGKVPIELGIGYAMFRKYDTYSYMKTSGACTHMTVQIDVNGFS